MLFFLGGVSPLSFRIPLFGDVVYFTSTMSPSSCNRREDTGYNRIQLQYFMNRICTENKFMKEEEPRTLCRAAYVLNRSDPSQKRHARTDAKGSISVIFPTSCLIDVILAFLGDVSPLFGRSLCVDGESGSFIDVVCFVFPTDSHSIA